MQPCENTKLLGYKEVEEKILRDFNNNKLHHSLLITGKKGIGKATFAYRLTNKILSSHLGTTAGFPDNNPVNAGNLDVEDLTFKKIKAGSHPDLMRIEVKIDEKTKKPKNTITIDSIKEMKDFLNLTPAISKHKVVIIDSADEMNINASNSILKLLEEPPENTFLFLISHNPGKLLSTIRSRCNEIKIKPLEYENWKNALKIFLDKKNNSNLSEEDFEVLSKFSDNSVYIAVEMLGNNGIDFYTEFVNLIDSKHIKQVVKFAEKISDKDFPWWLFEYVVKLFSTRVVKFKSFGTLDLFFCPEEERALRGLAKKNSLESLFNKCEKINDGVVNTLKLNLNKKNTVISLIKYLEN